MKIFWFFLVIIVGVTAAPSAPSDVHKLQSVILEEIMDNVKQLETSLSNTAKKIMVQEVITTKHCTHENFCKAGNVLDTLKAEDLGLNGQGWLLPRMLVAYTRNIQCKHPASIHKVELQDLLKNIQQCAQKMYAQR